MTTRAALAIGFAAGVLATVAAIAVAATMPAVTRWVFL